MWTTVERKHLETYDEVRLPIVNEFFANLHHGVKNGQSASQEFANHHRHRTRILGLGAAASRTGGAAASHTPTGDTNAVASGRGSCKGRAP